MNNIIVKKDFQNIRKGTEFVWNHKAQSWVHEWTDEVIGDGVYSSNTTKVRFSDNFIKSLPDVFGSPDEEKERQRKLKEIKDLERLIKRSQEEIEKLKA